VYRRALTPITAISLILCALTAAVWLPSYWRHFTLNRIHADHLLGFSVRSGDLVLVADSNPFRADPQTHWEFSAQPPDPFHLETRSRGIVRTFDKRLGVSSTLVYIPLWLPFLALALLPFYWFVTTRLIHWCLTHHRCPTCSYNLTANQSGICPECGTAVPATQ
jgi:hypothetical protein